jgi:hypothetical protein
VELFLRCWGFVWSLEPPWVAKHGGRPGYDARGLVLCALLKVKMDYRSISSYLKANPELLKIVGLDRAQSRETIKAALLKLPESYLRRLNGLLVEPFKKGSSSRLNKEVRNPVHNKKG